MEEACSDNGPILHLSETNSGNFLDIFKNVFISDQAEEELQKHKIPLPENAKHEKTNKDQTALLAEKYGLDIGEASALWLCKALKVELLLTDDLSTREAAKGLDIRPVGTIGVITRNFRDGKIGQETAIGALEKIHRESSLFITSELVNYAIGEIRKYKI